jgi:integrase/recombinase XerC
LKIEYLKINLDIVKILNEFLEYMEIQKRSSHNTIIAYQSDIFYFLKFFAKKLQHSPSKEELAKLELKDFRNWLIARNNNGFDKNSTIRAISVIRNFFAFMEKRNFLYNSHLKNLSSPKKDKNIPRAIDQVDIKSITFAVEKFTTQDWCQKRDLAIIFLIYSTGLRISEAFSILKSEIKQDYIKICGKGDKERSIPLMPMVKEKITDYLKKCPYKIGENNEIFLGSRGGVYNKTIFQKLIRDIRKYLQLPESITPHAFRHSCATHILEKGGDLRSIQELLGHASLSTTQKYTKVNKNHLMTSCLESHPRR